MRHPWAVPPGYRTTPPRFNIATEIVDRRVAQGAGDIALRDARGALSFAELADLVARCAGGLQSLGVERGTPFLLRSPNCREAYITFLAGVKLGAVPILANSLLGARELGHVVDNGEPALAVVHAEAAAAVAEVQRAGYRFRRVISIGDDIPGAIAFDGLLSAAKPAETATQGATTPPSSTTPPGPPGCRRASSRPIAGSSRTATSRGCTCR